MAQAWGGIVLGLSADADYFATLAKLRAARLIWDRLTSACGVTVAARIEARSSRRMLTAQDPWTNMLRQTAAGVGAALGGADAIQLGCFTDALGRPTPFARRQSRNAQLVLMEESHLGRVADPAGGAWFLESLTDDLARRAWARFQAIEAVQRAPHFSTLQPNRSAIHHRRMADLEPRGAGHEQARQDSGGNDDVCAIHCAWCVNIFDANQPLTVVCACIKPAGQCCNQ
jgi:hypothetical protein